jgi:hypothetical protein
LSETPDQPGAEAVIDSTQPGVAAEAPATTEAEIDTEAFDRMDAPDDEGDEGVGDGQPDKPEETSVAADDDEEVELSDGRKVKIPKEVALGTLRMADYTKKTQELAENRRAFETEQAQQLESLTAFRTEHLAIDRQESALAQIDKDIGEYRKLTPQDWAALKAQDPTAYDQHMSNFEILRTSKLSAQENLDDAKKELKAKETSLTEKRTAAQEAKRSEDWKSANVVLAKEIPGWGPDKFKEIGSFVMKTFGVKAEQLQDTADPIAWTMANRLMKAEAKVAQLEKAQAQTTTVARTVQAAEVKPAAKPAGGNAPPRGATDSLSTDEWMARRNAQAARKAAR